MCKAETETPLHRLETVYRRLCERLATASDAPSAFRPVLDSWLYALEEDVLAWVYVLDAFEGGLPSARYLGVLADAAEKAGAPDDYVIGLRMRPCRRAWP